MEIFIFFLDLYQLYDIIILFYYLFFFFVNFIFGGVFLGRPAGKKKTAFISISVTPEQKKMIVDRAAMLGVSISTYVVFQALGWKLGDVVFPIFDKGEKASD